jgi:hypothetical protein
VEGSRGIRVHLDEASSSISCPTTNTHTRIPCPPHTYAHANTQLLSHTLLGSLTTTPLQLLPYIFTDHILTRLPSHTPLFPDHHTLLQLLPVFLWITYTRLLSHTFRFPKHCTLTSPDFSLTTHTRLLSHTPRFPDHHTLTTSSLLFYGPPQSSLQGAMLIILILSSIGLLGCVRESTGTAG